jgi:dolichyl-phosphate-mannose--protein O-mannosyl transferase
MFNLGNSREEKCLIWGTIGVFIFAIGLRFWGLGRFNEFVFDEVYYAKFANNYLINKQFYNAHPPLSQYIIAIGIWIGDKLPIGHDTANTLTGSLRSTFSYRWMNAVFGSLIPPVVAALAYQLTRRWSYVFLAALFISLDGLFLVDSRYALNNVFLIFFGITGQLCVLLATNYRGYRQWWYLLGAGFLFGSSIACKWNGLWFLLGMGMLLAIAHIMRLINSPDRGASTLANPSANTSSNLLERLSRIHPLAIISTLVILPIIVYSLWWIPHLIQNPEPNFWGMQVSILNYHEKVGNGKAIHPYCADWYTWLLMMRPLAYYYKADEARNIYYDIHAIGNPLLWWLAFGSVLTSIWLIIKQLLLAHRRQINFIAIAIPLYIVVNYAANLLPWVRVNRCVFIYHYMGAILFAIMGLAWLVDRWLYSNSKLWQGIGLTVVFAIIIAFVFWLPIYLGLPLERTGLGLRLWHFWIFNWV